MHKISEYWKNRFADTVRPVISATPGWSAGGEPSDAFIEPSIVHCEGSDPKTAPIVLVSAPGAVGKSTYAKQICAELGLCNLQLALACPVGEHSFIGGATRALGNTAATRIKIGEVGIVIDALDEAQLRVAPEAYEAFLSD